MSLAYTAKLGLAISLINIRHHKIHGFLLKTYRVITIELLLMINLEKKINSLKNLFC